MAFKFWCVAPSHPLVTQLANKYGLTKKQAKTIINKARQNNPALNDDDLELNDIEDDDAFKKALGEYVQTVVEKQDVLLEDVKGLPKTRDDIRKELQDEELGLTAEQIEDILDRREELGSSVRTSHVSSKNIAKILGVFKNTKRLDVIGQYICRRTQEIVTLLETDPKYRKEAGVSEKSTRKDYFLSEDSANHIYEKVIDDLNVAIDNVVDGKIGKSDPEQFISELETAIDSYQTLLYMYGANLFRDEGIEVTLPGTQVDGKTIYTSEERNDTDTSDVNDSDDETEGEKKVFDFSASKQNQSVTSKIVPSIKILLSNCTEIDANGNPIYDDENYGFVKYISVPHAIATLLNTCNGCQTFDEMYKAIEVAESSNHWMRQILDALDKEYEYSENGVTKSTSSRKEQLQTMFFQSMRKQFMPFKHTYITYIDGYMCFANADSNVSHQYDRIMRNVRTRFYRMSGLPIFSNGQIRFSRITKLGEQCNAVSLNAQVAVSGALRALRNNDRAELKAVNEELAEISEQMRGILNEFGMKISKEAFKRFVSKPMEYSRTYSDDLSVAKYEIMEDNLMNVAKWTKSLSEEFGKWHKYMTDNEGKVNDNPSSNPFSNKRGAVTFSEVITIRNTYENIAENISYASPDSYESMARMAGKSYYSWNNPSSIQTIIESLSRDDRHEYMKKKYGADSVWYLKPESTPDNLVFYSDALNRIYNGQNIEYAEKPIVNETEYESIPDLVYALSILNDYYDTKGERDKSRAWFKTLIPSDKPRYGMVKLWRHNKRGANKYDEQDYRNEIARQAIDYFAQELRRSENVARDNALKDGVRFDTYDPKRTDEVEAVYAKMRSGKKVTHEDVVKNGRYIFRGSGISFYLNKFINDEIEKNSELGQYVIDKIFNSHLSNSDVRVVEDNIMSSFKDAFHAYMAKMKSEYIEKLRSIGAFEVETKTDENGTSNHARFIRGNIVRWHSDNENYVKDLYEGVYDKAAREYAKTTFGVTDEEYDKNEDDQPYYKEMVAFFEDVEEFIYNNWLAKADMSEIFDVDLAFYGDTPNFQKRNAQVVSSGYPVDPNAMLHGKKVSDGKYRTITIKTTKVKSKHIHNVDVALNQLLDQLDDKNEKMQFRAGIEDVISGLENFDPTDGQGLTSLTGLRKRLVGLGEWSRSNTEEEDMRGYTEDENGNRTYIFTDEAVYQRFKRHWQKTENEEFGTLGEYDEEVKAKDFLHVFAQTQKPFVYTFANVERNGRTVTVPVQLKNSEYALVYISAFMQTVAPKSQLAAISKFLEETAEEDQTKGIDTANFDSVVKIGNNNRSIDLGNKNGRQAYAALKEACYLKKKTAKAWMRYTPGAVIAYDVQDYKIVQQKPEHFKHNQQPLGSQLKMLAINNIPLDGMVTLPNGESITGKQLRDRYFDALRRKTEKSEWRFRGMLGLRAPESVRKNKISNVLKSAMATDQKFTSEMRRGMSIVNRDGVDQFVIPLDEPGQQSAVESMLFSKIRKTFYREKTNGGVVVQATSWGASDDLFIRFRSSDEDDIKNNGGLLQTIDQFRKKHKGLSEEELEKQYKEYAKKYQGDYDHFEMEIPMPDYVREMIADKKGNIDKKYFNEDGTWNMDEIKKVVPESAFEAICYRIPTEAKYSIMVCKVVRFAKEGSGSTAKYPKELTEFSGSDFDIDTDYVELRPIPGSSSYDIDNEIFDLQLAALRSIYARQETFKRGDFSDLSDESYKDVLLRSGRYTEEEVNAMDPKKAKELCKNVEDLDLMNPVTDIVLKNQNSDAGKMIGIAAVNVISHAFISVYNELDINDTDGVQEGNFTRVLLPKTKTNIAGFRVVNDKDKNHVIERAFSEYVILDPMHDMDGNLVSTQLSKYVGASADAAKDAALFRLNITQATLPILATMHRIGVSGTVARAFISQPVIRDVVRILSSQSAFRNGNLEDAVETVIQEITMNDKDFLDKSGNWSEKLVEKAWQDVSLSQNKKLVYSELMENKIHPEKQSTMKKMEQLHILLTMYEMSKSARNLDSFSRYNSATAMKGSSFFARYAERKKIERLANNLNSNKPIIALPDNVSVAEGYYGDNFGKLCTMFPHIAQVIFGESDLIDGVILDNMHTYSINFFEAAKRLRLDDPDQGTERFIEKLEKLYTGWKNYLLFVGPNRIADFYNESTAREYTRNIATKFFDFMDKLEKENKALYDELNENNEFIKSLSYEEAKDGYGDFFVISTDVAALNGIDVETYQRDWEAILDMPEMRNENGKPWATELAIHFLARGAAFARNTPVTRMPIRVKEALGSYTKAFEEADRYIMSENEISNFIATFCLNNSSKEDGIVPYFYNSKNKSVGEEDLKDGYGTFRLTFNAKYSGQIAKWTSSIDDNLILDVPVIAIYDKGTVKLFKVPDGTVQVSGSGDSRTYTITAIRTEPLGVPGQVSEYVGFNKNKSIFIDEGQPAPDQNKSEGKSDTSAIPDKEQMQLISSRGGSYIVSSPFDSLPMSQMGSMAEDVLNSNEGYLETRTHLIRAEKIIKSLGMKLGGINRGTDRSAPEYIINVKPTTNKTQQHENARRAAAMITALGNRMRTTRVKTYVTDEDGDFSHIEFSIPIKKTATRLKKNINLMMSLAGTAHDVEFNSDMNELLITVKANGDNSSEVMSAVNSAIDYVLNVQAILYKNGLAEDADVMYNTLMYDVITPTDAINIIKEIKDETDTVEQNNEGKDNESAPEDQGDETGDQIGIRNILDIAERRNKGQNVTEELRELFGERRFPLRNTGASYTSGQFVDAVRDEIDVDMLESIKNILYDRIYGKERNEAFNTEKAIDNLIINTANWLLGNIDQENAISSMKKSGIPEDYASSIIGTINDILEEMDIC